MLASAGRTSGPELRAGIRLGEGVLQLLGSVEHAKVGDRCLCVRDHLGHGAGDGRDAGEELVHPLRLASGSVLHNGSLLLGLTPAPDPSQAIAGDRFNENRIGLDHLSFSVGSKAELEEKLPFVVLEFNGDARRIVLSHTRTFEEGGDEVVEAPAAGKARGPRKENAGGGGSSASVKSVNEKVEKSTLGDLSVLSNLKSAMESNERASKGKKKEEEEASEDAE